VDRREPQIALDHALFFAHGFERAVDEPVSGLCGIKQDPARIRQLDPAASPRKQRLAKMGFESRQSPAQARLRQVQAVGGFRSRFELGDPDEVANLPVEICHRSNYPRSEPWRAMI
jgi:hypothetical protein